MYDRIWKKKKKRKRGRNKVFIKFEMAKPKSRHNSYPKNI